MKFLLDNDCDAEIGPILRKAGHTCDTAPGCGIADAKDDDVSVFAHDHGMVLLTHDRRFSKRRQKNVFGKHVYLDCRQFEAADVVAEHLEDLTAQLDTRQEIYLRLSKDHGVVPYANRWD